MPTGECQINSINLFVLSFKLGNSWLVHDQRFLRYERIDGLLSFPTHSRFCVVIILVKNMAKFNSTD